MKLYRDAMGVIVGTQVEAKRMGKGWEPIEVPTDKQGLIDYLNARSPIIPQPTPFIEAMATREPGQVVHASQADINAMFEPSRAATLSRDRVCEAIATYDGVDLGFVAMEVAARFKAMA